MTKADKIRRYLAKGMSISEIAKRVGVSNNHVHVLRWKDAHGAGSGKKKVAKKPKKAVKKDGVSDQLQQSLADLFTMTEAAKPEAVNHPPHYKSGGIETIDFIEAKDLNYRLGNVVKYVSRAGRKLDSDPVQDLEKAAWYLKREIEARKGA